MPFSQIFPQLDGLTIDAPHKSLFETVLTTDALAFIMQLHRTFNARRKFLLAEREVIQQNIDNGWKPHFLEETRCVRDGDWQVGALPHDLLDRRVEIT